MSCSNGSDGDMFMNYMDYVDDGCMAMFTEGQKTRMTATLNLTRSPMIFPGNCDGISAVTDLIGISEIQIYPNPGNGTFHVSAGTTFSYSSFQVIDLLGNILSNIEVNENSPGEFDIHMPDPAPGIYFVILKSGDEWWKNKFVVQ